MSFYDNPIRQDIAEACERVSRRLRTKLIVPVTISIPTTREMRDLKSSWPRKGLDWSESTFFDHPSLCRFKVVIKTQNKVLGVVENCYEKEDEYHGLVLEQIQRSVEKEHPLKGKLIAIFCETNLELAKFLGVEKISIDRPVEGTIPKYEKLGFRILRSNQAQYPYEAELDVKEDTQLNLRVFGL